jgi:hypothetical protein
MITYISVENCETTEDGIKLCAQIKEAIDEKIFLNVTFKKDIKWFFANRVMDFIYNNEDKDFDVEVRKHVKFFGFKNLPIASYNIMQAARSSAIRTNKYNNLNCYGEQW